MGGDARRRAAVGQRARQPARAAARRARPTGRRRARPTGGGDGRIVELPMAVTPRRASARHRHQPGHSRPPGCGGAWWRRRCARRSSTSSCTASTWATPTADEFPPALVARQPDLRRPLAHKLRRARGDAGRRARRGRRFAPLRRGRRGQRRATSVRRPSTALARQLVAALVLGDAGVARHLHELDVGQRREPAAHARDQLLVGLRLPALRQHADRVGASRCRRARGASPPPSPARSSARSIAVSSAMLLVPTPRYSPQLAPLAAVDGDDADPHRPRDSRSRRRRSTAPAPASGRGRGGFAGPSGAAAEAGRGRRHGDADVGRAARRRVTGLPAEGR